MKYIKYLLFILLLLSVTIKAGLDFSQLSAQKVTDITFLKEGYSSVIFNGMDHEQFIEEKLKGTLLEKVLDLNVILMVQSEEMITTVYISETSDCTQLLFASKNCTLPITNDYTNKEFDYFVYPSASLRYEIYDKKDFKGEKVRNIKIKDTDQAKLNDLAQLYDFEVTYGNGLSSFIRNEHLVVDVLIMLIFLSIIATTLLDLINNKYSYSLKRMYGSAPLSLIKTNVIKELITYLFLFTGFNFLLMSLATHLFGPIYSFELFKITSMYGFGSIVLVELFYVVIFLFLIGIRIKDLSNSKSLFLKMSVLIVLAFLWLYTITLTQFSVNTMYTNSKLDQGSKVYYEKLDGYYNNYFQGFDSVENLKHYMHSYYFIGDFTFAPDSNAPMDLVSIQIYKDDFYNYLMDTNVSNVGFVSENCSIDYYKQLDMDLEYITSKKNYIIPADCYVVIDEQTYLDYLNVELAPMVLQMTSFSFITKDPLDQARTTVKLVEPSSKGNQLVSVQQNEALIIQYILSLILLSSFYYIMYRLYILVFKRNEVIHLMYGKAPLLLTRFALSFELGLVVLSSVMFSFKYHWIDIMVLFLLLTGLNLLFVIVFNKKYLHRYIELEEHYD